MALRDDMLLLQAFPVFAAMEPEALQLVAFSAETRFLRSNDALFRRGDPADAAYIITSGRMLVSTPGGEPVTAIRGAMVGEIALFAETEYQGTAIAQETTSLMRIPRTVMRRVLEEFPDTAVNIFKILRQRTDTLYRDLQRVSVTLD
ncbi:cyclic nucleotide-binding domain-containing protein [Rhizobiales bacterium TNE-4]|nr:cyclic nucleotide-binding domain-containing protein [Rhizobiales bacterium TNE-4]MBV1828320.1 cyclic nucleotide-binding domain-containing protein [Rhizobiales bacterium TNE-4]